MTEAAGTTRAGLLHAFAAHLLWGLFPLYFRAVGSVPYAELLAHRVVWAVAFLVIPVTLGAGWGRLAQALRRPRTLALFGLSAVMLFLNWGTYLWAVGQGRVTEASLGYFMNPLVNVLLGAAFLGERLRPLQWLAVGCAGAGVVWLTIHAGAPPWLGLVLALSFGVYALLRKTSSLGAIDGLALESALLAPLAVAWLGWLALTDQAVFARAGTGMQCLIAASGPVTALPLLFFAAAARRIPLSILGIVQYLGPTMQLLLAVYVFGEPFDGVRLVGYAAIWMGLAIFSAESLARATRPRLA